MVFSTLLEYAAVSYLGNRKWKPRPALIVTTSPAAPPPHHSRPNYAALPASAAASGDVTAGVGVGGFPTGQMSPLLSAADIG